MSDGWLPSGAANEGQPQDAASWMGVGTLHSVRWAAHESGGLKSLRRSDEGRCIQRRG